MTFQASLKQLATDEFVGRKAELKVFEAALSVPKPEFLILSISGQAGVGKTALLHRFKDLATGRGYVALANERQDSVIAVLARLAEELHSHGAPMRDFEAAHARWQELHRQVASDSHAPNGVLDFASRASRASGIRNLFRAIPADDDSLARYQDYIEGKFSDTADRVLFAEADAQLTGYFIADLDRCSRSRHAVLCFDSYELTRGYLDTWLRSLIAGKFGDFSEKVLIVIAGRDQLDRPWLPYLGAIYGLKLDRFSAGEAADYLRRKKITGETHIERLVAVSDRLPGLLSLLVRSGGANSAFEPQETAVDLILRATSENQRAHALNASLARQLDQGVLTAAMEDEAAANRLFSQLKGAAFVEEHGRSWSYVDVIRRMMVERVHQRSSADYSRVHRLLADYFSRLANGQLAENDNLLVERLYHTLSADPGGHLHEALSGYLARLRSPSSFPFAIRWSQTIRQVADEADHLQLRRLADLIENGWKALESQDRYDRASDIFFRLSASKQLQIGRNTTDWLSYFEGRLALVRGEYDVAEKSFLDLWSRAEVERELRYCAAFDMSELETRRGRIAEAIKWDEEALKLARASQNSLQIGLALYQLGTIHKRRGEFERALELAKQSLDMFEKERDTDFHIARARLDQANTQIYMGRLQDAGESLQKCLEYFKRESPLSAGETMHRMGWLERLRGRLDRALELHQEAIRLLESLDEPFFVAKVQHSMGNVLAEQHRYTEALTAFGEALAAFRRFEAKRHVALALKDQSWALYCIGSKVAAITSLSDAAVQLQACDDQTGESEAYVELARIHLAEGQLADAEQLIARAANLCCTDKNPLLKMRLLSVQATVFISHGDFTRVEMIRNEIASHAKVRQMDNLLARAQILSSVLSLNSGDAFSAVDQLVQAFESGLRWNDYLPMDLAQQIAHDFSSNPVLTQRAEVTLDELVKRLQALHPDLREEVAVLVQARAHLRAVPSEKTLSASPPKVPPGVSSTVLSRQAPAQLTIFISYSHVDNKRKDQLLKHLKVLGYAEMCEVWCDDQIGGGGEWKTEISKAIERAKIAVLLISPDFLISQFIRSVEVPILLRRRQEEGLLIFPVLARQCNWEVTNWLTPLNVRPKDNQPIWGNPGRPIDTALKEIAKEISGIIDGELLDVCDTTGKLEGTARRGHVHRAGLWHRSFHGWIVYRSATGEDMVVFQRRGPTTGNWPKRLDISAAGHLAAGETSAQTGVRELREELGLNIMPSSLFKVGVRIVDEELDNDTHNREFQDVYFLRGIGDLAQFTPHFPEVQGVFEILISDVLDLLDNRVESVEARGRAVDPITRQCRDVKQPFTRQDFIPNALEYLRHVMELARAYLTDQSSPLAASSPYALRDGSHWHPEPRSI